MIFVNRMMFGREVLEVFKVDMMSVMIIMMSCQLVEFVLEIFHVSCMFAEIFDGCFCLVEIDTACVIVIVTIENRLQLVHCDRMIFVNRMMFDREVLEVIKSNMMCVMIAVSCCQLVEFVCEIFHMTSMRAEVLYGRLCLIEIDISCMIVIVLIEDCLQLIERNVVFRLWHYDDDVDWGCLLFLIKVKAEQN